MAVALAASEYPASVRSCAISREGSYVDSDGFVERDPEGLGLVQRIRVGGVAAEVVQVLLHFAGKWNRFAQVTQRLAGLIQPLPCPRSASP